MSYQEFLARKAESMEPVGFDVAPREINRMLYPFQRAVVRWALRRGRAAMFEDCGLGKTPQQLEWARHVCRRTGGDVLILAPLAVSEQTRREGDKFGIKVNVCREVADLRPGINITNYERLGRFEGHEFAGIVLDESSILKSYDGKTRRQITDFAQTIKYRLACTATPAPNDLIELVNHAEFLDVMSGKEIIALFFTQDGNTTHKWKLKGHAREAFWEWMASWSVAMRRPADLGYDDDRFDLEPLVLHDVIVDAPPVPWQLFSVEAQGIQERRAARRNSLVERVAACAERANASDEPWIIWCDLNAESKALTAAIPDAVEVCGSDSLDHKEASMMGFSAGDIRVLVTKPTIAGFGMNWQHCSNVAFVGLSDSYEQFYQAIRRCWRFGQRRQVDCWLITSEAEGAVKENIQRKERQASEMFDEIVARMSIHEIAGSQRREVMDYAENVCAGDDWTLHLGDSCEVMKQIEKDSVGLSIFSPPFPGMYAYTNSPRDVGNVKGIGELIEHFGYIIPDLLRVTMPGRSCCIHLTQEPVFKGRDGHVGLRDFRGRIILAMEDAGWIYYGEHTIDKNPQIKASRTKDHTLLFKTLAQDSSSCRAALADYLLQFRKPGENPVPIPSGQHKRWNPDAGWITPDEWCEWAAPVWYRSIGASEDRFESYPSRHQVTDGIRETDVLQVRGTKQDEDQKHLCPLQLGVIERAVKLWSAPGDLVLSPFAGIGSEGYKAIELGRRFVGIELKEGYWRAAISNMRRAELARERLQMPMFAEEVTE